MSSINLKSNIIATILSKGVILLLNFAIVVFTTRVWGAEGRGLIALFVADLGLIGIFANVFTGSSVSFYLAKLGTSKLATQAYWWTFVVTAVAAVVFSFTNNLSFVILLSVASIFMGIIAFHNSLFIGSQKIIYFNLLTVLQPLFLFVSLFVFYFFFPKIGCYSYFYAQLLSLFIMIIICRFLRKKNQWDLKYDFDITSVKQSFSFGWKTELSSLLQFFNYRLSYYLLNVFVGTASVGIFSLGVTISEAVWIVSRSMSLVQFSNVIKQGNTLESRKETMTIANYSLLISAVCLLLLFLIPESLFLSVFGSEFGEVKQVILWLSPGIIAIAFSNVIGNYFSAIKQLNILIIKSAIGLLLTVLLSLWLIPKWHIMGACIVNSASYILSSLILLLYYFSTKSTRAIHD